MYVQSPYTTPYKSKKIYSQSEQKFHITRYDNLCNALDSQQPKSKLDAHNQCKQRLVKPLQTNRKLRVLNELDSLVPDKECIIWAQSSGRENNPDLERLMEQVKSITNFSKHASKRWVKKTSKPSQNHEQKEDHLRQNLRKEIFQKIEQGRKKASVDQKIPLAERAMTEERNTSIERGEEIAKDDGNERPLSDALKHKKGMKQLNKNVHFRYTSRKVLLLRSLDALPSNEKIVRAFFKKTEDESADTDYMIKQDQQQLTEDTKLIITKKKELSEFQQKLKSHSDLIETERIGKRRGSAPFFLTQNKPDFPGRRHHRQNSNSTSDAQNIFLSTLQHLDDMPSSTKLDSINNESELKEATTSVDRLKSEGVFERTPQKLNTLGVYENRMLRSECGPRPYSRVGLSNFSNISNRSSDIKRVPNKNRSFITSVDFYEATNNPARRLTFNHVADQEPKKLYATAVKTKSFGRMSVREVCEQLPNSARLQTAPNSRNTLSHGNGINTLTTLEDSERYVFDEREYTEEWPKESSNWAVNARHHPFATIRAITNNSRANTLEQDSEAILNW